MTPPNSGAFSAEQYDEAYPRGYETHFWHRARRDIVLAQVAQHCTPRATTLEIGCGPGYYVQVLRDAGFDAYGCELATPNVHPSVSERVFTGRDFADLPADFRNEVKCVLVLDVLEHIENAGAFLAGVKAAFPRLEVVIATVPACPELWSNYDTHYGHYRRYLLPELSALFSAQGFAVARNSYFFHALYLVTRFLASSGKDRNTAFPQPRWSLPHWALGLLFRIESLVLPKSWRGTSLICTATVNAPR